MFCLVNLILISQIQEYRLAIVAERHRLARGLASILVQPVNRKLKLGLRIAVRPDYRFFGAPILLLNPDRELLDHVVSISPGRGIRCQLKRSRQQSRVVRHAVDDCAGHRLQQVLRAAGVLRIVYLQPGFRLGNLIPVVFNLAAVVVPDVQVGKRNVSLPVRLSSPHRFVAVLPGFAQQLEFRSACACPGKRNLRLHIVSGSPVSGVVLGQRDTASGNICNINCLHGSRFALLSRLFQAELPGNYPAFVLMEGLVVGSVPDIVSFRGVRIRHALHHAVHSGSCAVRFPIHINREIQIDFPAAIQ